MKKLLLKQKQVLFFIIAGGLSAIVEIGSFKLFSVNIPKIFPQLKIGNVIKSSSPVPHK